MTSDKHVERARACLTGIDGVGVGLDGVGSTDVRSLAAEFAAVEAEAIEVGRRTGVAAAALLCAKRAAASRLSDTRVESQTCADAHYRRRAMGDSTPDLCSDCEHDYTPAKCHYGSAAARRLDSLEKRVESAEAALRAFATYKGTPAADHFIRFPPKPACSCRHARYGITERATIDPQCPVHGTEARGP